MLQLTTGNVVKLNSGGLPMTVAKVDANVDPGGQTMAWITCQWHTDHGYLMIGNFPIESLTALG